MITVTATILMLSSIYPSVVTDGSELARLQWNNCELVAMSPVCQPDGTHVFYCTVVDLSQERRPVAVGDGLFARCREGTVRRVLGSGMEVRTVERGALTLHPTRCLPRAVMSPDGHLAATVGVADNHCPDARAVVVGRLGDAPVAIAWSGREVKVDGRELYIGTIDPNVAFNNCGGLAFGSTVHNGPLLDDPGVWAVWRDELSSGLELVLPGTHEDWLQGFQIDRSPNGLSINERGDILLTGMTPPAADGVDLHHVLLHRDGELYPIVRTGDRPTEMPDYVFTGPYRNLRFLSGGGVMFSAAVLNATGITSPAGLDLKDRVDRLEYGLWRADFAGDIRRVPVPKAEWDGGAGRLFRIQDVAVQNDRLTAIQASYMVGLRRPIVALWQARQITRGDEEWHLVSQEGHVIEFADRTATIEAILPGVTAQADGSILSQALVTPEGCEGSISTGWHVSAGGRPTLLAYVGMRIGDLAVQEFSLPGSFNQVLHSYGTACSELIPLPLTLTSDDEGQSLKWRLRFERLRPAPDDVQPER